MDELQTLIDSMATDILTDLNELLADPSSKVTQISMDAMEDIATVLDGQAMRVAIGVQIAAVLHLQKAVLLPAVATVLSSGLAQTKGERDRLLRVLGNELIENVDDVLQASERVVEKTPNTPPVQ